MAKDGGFQALCGGKPLTNRLILVLDDDIQLANVIGRMLERAGARVVLANDGLTATRLFSEAGPFDAILSDVHLQAETGMDVVRRLPVQGVRILYMSGNPDGLLQPPSPMLRKPFKPARLVAAMTAILAAPH